MIECDICHGIGNVVFHWTKDAIDLLMPWRAGDPLGISLMKCKCIGGLELPCCWGQAEMICWFNCPVRQMKGPRPPRIFEDVQYGKKAK